MKLKDQVCSLNLAKKLKRLGVKQESLFWWVLYPQRKVAYSLVNKEVKDYPFKRSPHKDQIAAFTSSELAEILPSVIGYHHLEISKVDKIWQVAYAKATSYFIEEDYSLVDALAKMLILVLEEEKLERDLVNMPKNTKKVGILKVAPNNENSKIIGKLSLD